MTVTVIGAGLSGLATAWFLSERKVGARVVDAGARPGGLIHTRRVPEGLIETAARAFTWTPPVEALFKALEVNPVFAREESRRRYIFRDGRPKRWPLTPVETASLAARAGGAWLTRQMTPRDRETVAAWGARVLGRAATAWLLAPALQGIYASPPDELSAAAIFGKDRPKGRTLAAPAGGMGELLDRLRDALEARGVSFEFNTTVSARDISPAKPAIICTNAPSAAALLAPHAPEVAATVSRIRMVATLAVHAFFTPHPADARGFGILFPRAAGVRALGAVFNADVFPHRSTLRSETWIYGDLDPGALPGDDDSAAAAMMSDRAVLTGRSDAAVAAYVTRQAPALPVYDAAVLDARASLTTLPPHMALAGNYLGRLGVSNLVEGAEEAAQRLSAHSASP